MTSEAYLKAMRISPGSLGITDLQKDLTLGISFSEPSYHAVGSPSQKERITLSPRNRKRLNKTLDVEVMWQNIDGFGHIQ